MLEPVRPMLVVDRVQVWEIVELRRRAQDRDLHGIHVVAALHEVPARVGVGEVGAEPQLVHRPVRSLEPDGGAVEPVVIPDEHAVVIEVLPRQVERRPVVPAGDRHGVLDDVPRLVQLAGVIEHRGAGWQQRSPRAAADAVRGDVAGAVDERARRVTPWESIRVDIEAALAGPRLQRNEMADVVERRGGTVRKARRVGAARLRRDQHDALAGARAIDRARGRALQDLDVLDVVGVQVDGAILHHGALTRVAAVVRVEARRRNGRVVDRHAIHHEQRLVVADNRANAADLNERRCAGIAGLAGDLDVRGLGGERLDDVLLVAALDLIRRDGVADVAELLGRRHRAGAGHHHLTELQRVGGEREVLGDEPFGELHGDRLRLVAEAARGHLHRLARDARARDVDGVPPIVARHRPHAEAGDRDLRVREGGAVLALHAAVDGDGVLRERAGRREHHEGADERQQPTA